MRSAVVLLVLLAPVAHAQPLADWWRAPTTYGALNGGVVAVLLGIEAVEAVGATAPGSTVAVFAAIPVGMAAGAVVAGHLTGREGAPLGALGGAAVGLTPGLALLGGAFLAGDAASNVDLLLFVGSGVSMAVLGSVGAAVGYEGAWHRVRVLPMGRSSGPGLTLRVGL